VIVGFTTTYKISAYHPWWCEFESLSGRGVQHFVLKFITDLRQVDGFLWVLPVSSTIKTDHHDIVEIVVSVFKHHKTKHIIRQNYAHNYILQKTVRVRTTGSQGC